MTWEDIKIYVISALIVIVDEFVKHPIASATAVVGLLYVFERYRTQRAIRKKTEKELE